MISSLLLIGILAKCDFVVSLVYARGDTALIEQQVMELVKDMDSIDEKSRMKVLSQVDSQRLTLLGILLRHLGTSPSKNVQAAAIYLIGRHRLSDGVDELMKYIDFAPDMKRQIMEPEPLWEQYPAMEALITIGKPSVPAALKLLATETGDLRRSLAVKVIRYVEGADVARFLLDQAYAAESDAARKENLADARSRLNKLPH